MYRPPLPPQEIFLELVSVRGCQPQGHSAAGRIVSMKNFSYIIGNRTRDLRACSAVPQPTAPPRASPPTSPKSYVYLPFKTVRVDPSFVH